MQDIAQIPQCILSRQFVNNTVFADTSDVWVIASICFRDWTSALCLLRMEVLFQFPYSFQGYAFSNTAQAMVKPSCSKRSEEVQIGYGFPEQAGDIWAYVQRTRRAFIYRVFARQDIRSIGL